MFSRLSKNKAKKSGPLKALSSVFTGNDQEKITPDDSSPRTKSSSSSSSSPAKNSGGGTKKKKSPTSPIISAWEHVPLGSKDDLSVGEKEAGRKKKSKVKANPFATTTPRMWRPMSMTGSVTRRKEGQEEEEDVYRSFTNFDMLRIGEAQAQAGQSHLPATGDLRNEEYLHHPHPQDNPSHHHHHQHHPSHNQHQTRSSKRQPPPPPPPPLSRTISQPVTSSEYQASHDVVGGDVIPPADYDHDHNLDFFNPSTSPVRSSRSRASESEAGVVDRPQKKRLEPRRSAPPVPARHSSSSSSSSVKRTAAASSSTLSSSLSSSLSAAVTTVPLKPRGHFIEEETQGVVGGVERGASVEGSPQRRSRPSARDPAPVPLAVHPHPSFPTMNGGRDIPVDYPRDSSPSSPSSFSASSSSASRSSGSHRSRSPSEGSRGRAGSSLERRGRSVMDSSCQVVGDDVSGSVRHVLASSYGPGNMESASKDVEGMLARLKWTIETLKTLQVASSGSQFQTVKQELHLQTKQFVQDAKVFVGSANGPKPGDSGHPQLDAAMHTLGRVLLHGQAAMVRMGSVHQAQHLGFDLLKVAASFKSTVAAANAATGKPGTDPHVKYLMRQATNLAGLLSTLLKTIRALEQT